jgi:hypothetical protein
MIAAQTPAPPANVSSLAPGFTSASPARATDGVPHAKLSKGRRIPSLTVIISPKLRRAAVEFDGEMVAWDVTHRENGKSWTVRVRVTPLDGTVYRIVRRDGRAAIEPAMGLGPGQKFVTVDWAPRPSKSHPRA